MEWVQVYDPLGSAVWSPVAAGLPIVVLLGLLLLGVSAPRAALAGLTAAVVVAIGVFKMPVAAALAAAAYGGCFGLLPIGWIVLAAVFLYHLTVRTGQFEIVKRSVTAISPDQRMQALLIAFSFGTFLEGAAGFGTPVAISAALLIGLGFSPLYAAGLALLANTSPVAFGGLGTPIITLAESLRHRRDGAEPDGRPATDALLADHSRVAGGADVGLEGREGLLAGDPRLRRQLRRRPVLHVQLARARRWSTWSAASARWWRPPCSCNSGSRRKSGGSRRKRTRSADSADGGRRVGSSAMDRQAGVAPTRVPCPTPLAGLCRSRHAKWPTPGCLG